MFEHITKYFVSPDLIVVLNLFLLIYLAIILFSVSYWLINESFAAPLDFYRLD